MGKLYFSCQLIDFECRPFGGELFLDSSYDDFVRAIDEGVSSRISKMFYLRRK